MTTQITEPRPTFRSRSISGSASTTMVVSTAVMSTPVITTSNPHPLPRPVLAPSPMRGFLAASRARLPPGRRPGNSGTAVPVPAATNGQNARMRGHLITADGESHEITG